MKTAVLITIGDEILSGNTVDTNSNFIATQLKEIGIKVLSIFTIPDEEKAIVSTLGKALKWLMWFLQPADWDQRKMILPKKLMPISSKMK
jgi:molybdopterin-biosynthesis enzyme MoeA-like protein